jgi:hypothetical protein
MTRFPANQDSEEAPITRGLLGASEGFYGVFYTFPERDDLICWLGQHGFNFYLYGPKNDRQHRARWREKYPARIMNQFAITVEAARSVGIDFCYGISPGSDICCRSADDFACLAGKLRGFYDIGVRCFALEDYLTQMDENGYTLKFRLENLALRNNLLPWIEIMEHNMWLAHFSLKVLRMLEQAQEYLPALSRVHEYREWITRHPKQIATGALYQIADIALEKTAVFQQSVVKEMK